MSSALNRTLNFITSGTSCRSTLCWKIMPPDRNAAEELNHLAVELAEAFVLSLHFKGARSHPGGRRLISGELKAAFVLCSGGGAPLRAGGAPLRAGGAHLRAGGAPVRTPTPRFTASGLLQQTEPDITEPTERSAPEMCDDAAHLHQVKSRLCCTVQVKQYQHANRGHLDGVCSQNTGSPSGCRRIRRPIWKCGALPTRTSCLNTDLKSRNRLI